MNENQTLKSERETARKGQAVLEKRMKVLEKENERLNLIIEQEKNSSNTPSDTEDELSYGKYTPEQVEKTLEENRYLR